MNVLPETIHYTLGDCVEGMKQFPDRFFDLAVVDPPYGIGVMSMNYTKSGAIRTHGNSAATRRDYRKKAEWDIRPTKEYFDELSRVSKKYIVWGGNYFSDYLTPTHGFICWDKRCIESMSNDFADCEYAYLSKGLGVARMFRFVWNGMLQGNMAEKEDRIHPTQKPVRLYEWILNRYANKGDKILDTHVGSGSSMIACARMGFEAWGWEIDEDYYRTSVERIERETAQGTLF